MCVWQFVENTLTALLPNTLIKSGAELDWISELARVNVLTFLDGLETSIVATTLANISTAPATVIVAVPESIVS